MPHRRQSLLISIHQPTERPKGPPEYVRADLVLARSVALDVVTQMLNQPDCRALVLVDVNRPTDECPEGAVNCLHEHRLTYSNVRVFTNDTGLLENLSAPDTVTRLLNEFLRDPDPGPGAPVEPRVTQGPHLTRGEIRVVECLALGRSTKAAARDLGIAESTVKTIRARVYQKLDVRNSAGAVAAAMRNGLLTQAS